MICFFCKKRISRLERAMQGTYWIERDKPVHLRCCFGLAKVMWDLVDQAAAPRANCFGKFDFRVWVNDARRALGWPATEREQ